MRGRETEKMIVSFLTLMEFIHALEYVWKRSMLCTLTSLKMCLCLISLSLNSPPQLYFFHSPFSTVTEPPQPRWRLIPATTKAFEPYTCALLSHFPQLFTCPSLSLYLSFKFSHLSLTPPSHPTFCCFSSRPKSVAVKPVMDAAFFFTIERFLAHKKDSVLTAAHICRCCFGRPVKKKKHE